MRVLWMIMVVWIILLMVTAGCEEAQQQWGQGELPDGWRGIFGNSNIARLDYLQTQSINQHQAIIYGLDLKDPNGQMIHKRGLVERITALEGQIEKLEANAIMDGDEFETIVVEDKHPDNLMRIDYRRFIRKVDPNE